MSIFQIEEAQREGARLVIGLAGISGSGKTYTALQLAWGLANGDSRKVGLICTENKRGRLYSDALRDADGVIHRFMVGDLVAPFSPARYIEAIGEFVAAGVEVIVIDSVSHEYEGIGGVEELSCNGKKWNDAKREHKRFMNVLLSSPVHVIACMRAREKVKVTDGGKKVDSLGIQPIQEKNFTFELTASMMMHDGGRQREVLKCPDELADIFGKSGDWAKGYITSDDGRNLRRWVDGGKQVDPKVQAARDTLQMNADKGLKALQDAWAALPAAMRKAISPAKPHGCPDDLKSSAAAFDKLSKSAGANDNTEAIDDLNNSVLGTDNHQAA